jgi:hypothetical protein
LEALACREAILLAKDIDARCIRVASDCMNVIRSIEDGTKGTYDRIIQEVTESMKKFDEVSFSMKDEAQIKRPIAGQGVLFLKNKVVNFGF